MSIGNTLSLSLSLHQGKLPLLVSMPHVGTLIPDSLRARMTPAALQIADTDWHLDRLYNMLDQLDVSYLRAHFSRYVIDLNRPQDDANLYPGQDTTGLCPLDTFAKEAIYLEGENPAPSEIQRRIETYWQPYHQQLQQELQRLLQQHGVVVLWDAHSIASQVPRFFDGRLPDLNFGTVNQQSCAASLQAALQDMLQVHPVAKHYSQIWNGRFKGGHITRAYGQPAQGVHAIQLEMSQIVYMNETPPFDFLATRAAPMQTLLKDMLTTCLTWCAQQTEQRI